MTLVTITTQKAKAPGNLADEYLHLKAQLADLKRQEADLQKMILATGKDVIEGNFGRVSVSEISDRNQIDYKQAAETLIAPAKLATFTKFVQGGFRFNVRARRGDEEKAA